ncbi:MAG: hypothetical protein FJW20_01505 [Acidimicrobiia bacterium]|nr:hypothetical protein [Acidimicrobiia bacterium]
MSKKLLLMAALCALATSLYAQTSAEILGVVRDPSGAAASEAKITVRNLGTNVARETTADVDGRFRLPLLPIGSYEIIVEKAGFAKYVQGPIVLRLNQNADLTVRLEVSSVTETVTVMGDAPIINTTNAEIGANFDVKRISELPLAPSRNVLNLALNVAGVAQLSSGQSTFAASGNNGLDAGVNFSVNGMRTRSNNFMLDGQDTNDPSVSGMIQSVNNPDMVAEVRLITNQPAAEFGRAAGSTVNIITKQGTNSFHGSGFWFNNNDDFNAMNNLDSNRGLKQAPFRNNNQVGLTWGGPVWIPKVYNGKDKTFFFTSGQRWQDRAQGSGSTLRGAPTEAGRAALQPFGNRPQVKALLDFVPAAPAPNGQTASFTNAGRTIVVPLGNLTGSGTQSFDNWQMSSRIDHVFSDKHRTGGRYMYDDSFSSGSGQLTPPGHGTIVPSRRQAATSWLTSTLSPTFYSELRLSYQRFASVTTAADPRTESIPSIEINDLGMTGFNAATARTGLGLAVNLPQFRRNNTYQIQETITWIKGTHSMKFGLDFRRQDVVSFFLPTIRGRLVYNNLQDLVDDLAQSSQINAPMPGGEPLQYYKFNDYFFFLQDEWRATSNLTLTYGIRYESPGNPFLNLANSNQRIVAAFNGDERFRMNPVPNRDNNNWAPRLGFNYRFGQAPGALGLLTGDGKLVFRGGYARTYDVQFINIPLNIGSAFPFLNSNQLPARTPNSFAALPALVAVANFPNPLSLTQTQVDASFRAPLAEQLSAQLQRGVGKDWAVTFGWVATKGTALFQTTDGNPTVPGSLGARRVDPTLGVRRVRRNAASSIYHSFQTSLEKRLSGDFSMGAHYTWSAFIDQASEVFNPAVNGDVAVAQDSFNWRNDRGRSTFDRPHRFTATAVYEIPYQKQQQGLAGRILGGWQINGFITFQSGAPFTPLAGIDPGRALSGIDGLVGNSVRPHALQSLKGLTVADAFAFNLPRAVNDSANTLFQSVTAASPLGSLGRNTFRADGIANLDFGAFKNFKIVEGHRLQFRAEFFNLTNTRNFGIPESRINSVNFLNQWGQDGGNRRMMLGLRYTF